MKLYGKVTEKNDEGRPFVTKGKEYKVFEEYSDKYVIIDDSGSSNNLSKNPYNSGFYINWFDLTPPTLYCSTPNEDANTLEDIIVELKSINHSLESYKLEVIIDDLVEINKLNK